jgi:hypothetical protein
MSEPITTSPLAVATQVRVHYTRCKAEAAIRRLDEQGKPITFAAVAAAASVSRSWLYRESGIRAEINRLRAGQGGGARPSAERASAESVRRQREVLLAEIARLREENRHLREEVARVFGERRASER